MKSDTFKDHFSGHANAYANARPHYPEALFEWLATLTVQHDLVWDCGTGNGQAAVALTKHYSRVHATDASDTQIRNAFPHPQVEFHVVPAERSGLEPDSADLVTVAQAAHWFDLPAFYAEVRRVAKPGAVIAIWCYGLCRIIPEVDAVVSDFYEGESKSYWPPERRLIDGCYRDLPFAFDEFEPASISMTQNWTLQQFMGYLNTWSAVQRYIRQTGRDPMPALATALEQAWGAPGTAREVVWPLHFRVGRVEKQAG